MALNEHANNKTKERETEGFLSHRKVACSLSRSSWNLCRISKQGESGPVGSSPNRETESSE